MVYVWREKNWFFFFFNKREEVKPVEIKSEDSWREASKSRGDNEIKEEKKNKKSCLHWLKNILNLNKMSENKLVKSFTSAAMITGLAAGYGWVAKKVIKKTDDEWSKF